MPRLEACGEGAARRIRGKAHAGRWRSRAKPLCQAECAGLGWAGGRGLHAAKMP